MALLRFSNQLSSLPKGCPHAWFVNLSKQLRMLLESGELTQVEFESARTYLYELSVDAAAAFKMGAAHPMKLLGAK